MAGDRRRHLLLNGLGVRLTLARLRRAPEQFLFQARERPAFSRRQASQLHGTQGNALEAHDLVVEAREHAANLAILALGKDDAQPGAVALLLARPHATCLVLPLAE